MSSGSPTDTAAETVAGAVAFTDLVGFTEFTAEQGDEQALEVLSAQESEVRSALPEGARLIKELGDGLMLWFPDAAQAVATLIWLQWRFRQTEVGGLPSLWVRMGLHWGRQTRRRDDLVGHDVNVAARIVDQANPHEILVSEQTVRQMGDTAEGVTFAPIGPVSMKGLPDPIWLYRAERHLPG